MMSDIRPLSSIHPPLPIIRNPLMVAPTTRVQDAIASMAETGSSCLLVVEQSDTDANGTGLIGILTERDIVRISAQAIPGSESLLSAVMSHPVITLKESDLIDINTALALFQQHRIRHLPLLDDHDQVVGLLTQESLTELLAQQILETGLTTDSHRTLELAVSQSEQTTRAIVEAIPDLLIRMDQSGQYLDVLAGSGIQVKLPPSNSAPLTASTILPPDLADLRLTYAQRALASGSLQIYEQLFDIEGDLRHEEVRTVPMNDQEVLVMIRDITDRKLAEIQLNQYKDMISNMKDGVALVDRNYIYQVVNQVYLDRTQKQWNEIVGHSVAELHGETVFRTMIQPRFDQCLAGEIQEYEDWFDFATIGRRFVRVTYSPYFELDGSINGVVVTTYDRTALKQAESQIEIQNAILERIAKAEPLADILTALLQAMEWPLDGAFCSVMICDQDGR